MLLLLLQTPLFQILIGTQRANGPDSKSSEMLKKLEKKKIELDGKGSNFMAMSIGDQVEKLFAIFRSYGPQNQKKYPPDSM